MMGVAQWLTLAVAIATLIVDIAQLVITAKRGKRDDRG